jgi:hypothetical protein
LTEAAPADQRPGPVATADVEIAHEGPELDRAGSLPAAVEVTIVGNPGVGAASGTGEDEQPLVPLEERSQVFGLPQGRFRDDGVGILHGISRVLAVRTELRLNAV